jgi:hypothetical protein
MNKLMSFPYKRIFDVGKYLAEFALEFIPGNVDLNKYDDNYFAELFDFWYEKFIRYAETNNLITREELMILNENPNGLDGFIKEAATQAAREIIFEKV